jgi:hypothetical protein
VTITRLVRSNERWVSQTFGSGVILIDTQSSPDRTRDMDAEERAFWHERGQLIDRVIEETRRTNPEHWAFSILQENVSYGFDIWSMLLTRASGAARHSVVWAGVSCVPDPPRNGISSFFCDRSRQRTRVRKLLLRWAVTF